MDFIVDNYLWFIVGGIVVLMIIIGFIAEKTDFGRKPFSQNKKEKSEKNKMIEESNEETPIESDESEEIVTDSMFELPIEDAQTEDAMISETDQIDTDLEKPIEEVLPENTDDEFVPDLDISALSEVEEVNEKNLEVVEDIAADDSEDDVWKF